MKKEDFFQKMKDAMAEKGNRFWLMIFVVVSTLTILIIWTLDIKNTYSFGSNWDEDAKDLGIAEIKMEVKDDMSELSDLLKNIKDESGVSTSTENISTTGTSSDVILDSDEMEKLKQILDNKIANSSSTEELSSSSVPSLYPELDDSEKTIQDLKKKIKELEDKQ